MLLPNKEELVSFLLEMQELLKQEPPYIELDQGKSRLVVMGDVHSDIKAVRHIIKQYFKRDTMLVGLGDYVDRTVESGNGIKTILTLFELKKKHPKRVLLLRGNHEFREMNSMYGFKDEVVKAYDENIWRLFNDVFVELPVVAKTTNGVLMLHGGLPDISSLDELKTMQKVREFNQNPIVDQMVWNDCFPRAKAKDMSDRGVPNAFHFGQQFFVRIMKTIGANVLLRGHQFPVKGVMFDGRCITLQTTKLYKDHPLPSGKLYKNLKPPLPGQTIAIVPPTTVRWAQDMEIVDISQPSKRMDVTSRTNQA